MRIFMQTPPEPGKAPRFYQLILHQDLLGGWSLIRQWGQTGSRATARREHYADLTQAQEALQRHRAIQVNKGFRVMFVQGSEH